MKDEVSGHYSFQDTDTMNEALKVFIKNNTKNMVVTFLIAVVIDGLFLKDFLLVRFRSCRDMRIDH